MKTLHVIPAIAERYGGTSNAVISMVTALNQLPNMYAEIATTDADGSGGRLARNSLPPELPVHLFPRTWSERWKMSLNLRSWLRKHARNYDLIDTHAIWSFTTSTAGRAAELNRMPYTVRPAGMLSPYAFQHGAWTKRIYWNTIESRTIRGAAGFHVTSTEEAAEVRSLRADARTFVIPNGVSSEGFTLPAAPNRLREMCGLSDSDIPILLFLSRLHPKKGVVERLLPAMAKVRTNCFLAIVGNRDDHAPEYEDEVRASIGRLGLESRVAMLGAVTGDDRWSMFDGAALFVLPSFAENFGIVVAEAMARGCPVVVTREVQSCALVEQAGAGLVVDGEVPELVAALDSMLADPAKCRAAGEQGRSFAMQSLQWSDVALRLRSMYEDVCNRYRG